MLEHVLSMHGLAASVQQSDTTVVYSSHENIRWGRDPDMNNEKWSFTKASAMLTLL
jgi:hypothetical protein